jgi:hypothetical protein
VDRSVLRWVGSQLSADLRDLDNAVQRLRASGRGAGSVTGWPTANAFSANADNAVTGLLQASQQAADAHQDISTKLADSASTYDDAEEDNRRAVSSVSQLLRGLAGGGDAPGRPLTGRAGPAAGATARRGRG